MRTAARLLLAGAVAAASFGITSPASACEYPKPGCGGCRLNLRGYLEDNERPVDCPS